MWALLIAATAGAVDVRRCVVGAELVVPWNGDDLPVNARPTLLLDAPVLRDACPQEAIGVRLHVDGEPTPVPVPGHVECGDTVARFVPDAPLPEGVFVDVVASRGLDAALGFPQGTVDLVVDARTVRTATAVDPVPADATAEVSLTVDSSDPRPITLFELGVATDVDLATADVTFPDGTTWTAPSPWLAYPNSAAREDCPELRPPRLAPGDAVDLTVVLRGADGSASDPHATTVVVVDDPLQPRPSCGCAQGRVASGWIALLGVAGLRRRRARKAGGCVTVACRRGDTCRASCRASPCS